MSKKKKVLECIRQGLIGGGESHLLVLMEKIDRARFEPVVLSFTDGPMIARLNEIGVRNFVIPSERPFDMIIWREVKKLLIQEKIDLIHVHGSRANSNVLWAARSLNIPVIYTIHGWSFHDDQNYFTRRLRIWGEKYLTSRSAVNISVSASNQESGKKYIKGFESLVINNGIDQERFNPKNRYADIRAEFGIGASKILVLFLARFTAHKQPLPLIEAFERALKHNGDLCLLMVGDGDQKEKATRHIAERGLTEHIKLISFRQDVPDIIAAADIYVLPSLWEGLPIALLEAMAMGKAVIGTRVDGTREVIQDRQNGLLVETVNLVPDLEEKILLLSRDNTLKQSLQLNAMATINERFNAVCMTRKIEDIYNQVTANLN